MAILRILIVLSLCAFMAEASDEEMSQVLISDEIITSTLDYSDYDPQMTPTHTIETSAPLTTQSMAAPTSTPGLI